MADSNELFGAAEQSNEQPTAMPFTRELADLQKSVGSRFEDVPPMLSEEDIRKLEIELIGDSTYESFNELFRRNELLYRRAALQRLAVFKENEEPSEESVQELVAANRAAVYHEYFQRTINHVTGILRQYESLRSVMPTVPESIVRDEQKMKAYIAELESAVSERTLFANILLVDAQIAQGGDKERLTELRKRLMSQITSEATRTALTGDTAEQWKRGNALNQRIIDILAGKHGLQGIDDGFVPQRVYIDLLKHRYTSLLERQKEIVRDPRSVQAESEMKQLELKLELSKNGTGEFTAADKERLESLRAQFSDRNTEIERLAEQRKSTLQELIDLSDELGVYQLHQGELATIQHQFGEKVDLTGATLPRTDTTPSFVREAMEENMETRSNFHIDRMDSMMGYMEENVLEAGWKEKLENAWTKDGREAVRQVAHKVADIITIPVPGMLGLKNSAQEALTGSLDEALGWPAGKDNWDELTPEEKANVADKAKSILDAIEAFDRSTITRTRETMAAVKAMPDASEFVGQEVLEPLPTERVTPDNMDQLIKEHGGATVYFMLFEQMEADFGSAEQGTGFMGEYKEFLEAINENIDVKIDVSKSLMELSSAYAWITKELLIAALVILGAGLVTGAVAARYLSKAASGTLELGGKLASGTLRQLGKLRYLRAPEFLTKLRYLKQERELANYLRTSRAGEAISRLNVLRGTRFAEGVGRVGKGLGRAAEGLAVIAIPAVAAYEIYLNQKRQELIKDNDELREEYASQNTTTLLEAGGFTAVLGVSAGPAIVLAAPVWWAAEKSKSRSENRANWKREAADWMAEYSSAQMLQKLHDMAPGKELETGDEALRTRGSDVFFRTFGYGEELDQEANEAVETVSRGNAVARGQVYEGYFTANLLVPEGTKPEVAERLVRSKTRYLRILSHGGNERVSPQNLRMADAYADLVERYHTLQKKGEPTLISYFDAQNERQWLDLEKLLSGTRQEQLSIVADYVNNIRTLQDLVLFNTMGNMALDHLNPEVRRRERTKAETHVREALQLHILHDLHEAERAIEHIDWEGLEITGAEGKSEMLVRWYVRFQLTSKINAAVPKLLSGELSEQQYKALQLSLSAIVEEVRNIDVNSGDAAAYFTKAKQYLSRSGGDENVKKALDYTKDNPLYSLLGSE